MNKNIKEHIQSYLNRIDKSKNIFYEKRKTYDQSVFIINEAISLLVDHEQKSAQKAISHYFEKSITDGLDYNIYVGDSIIDHQKISPIFVRHLYLWQLTTLCKAAWINNYLNEHLILPLELCHLILINSTPITILFNNEEKHFKVDGAYNARYEIIKKRIDKATVFHQKDPSFHKSHPTHKSNRLTQPGYIAIVYSQEHEQKMVKELVEYLQEIRYLEPEAEDLVIDDLQGVKGLNAIRAKIKKTIPYDFKIPPYLQELLDAYNK
tara:strand:- start:2320 stop:3114 length:795 start_codon:yes stop_codon:yes gene_type:complete